MRHHVRHEQRVRLRLPARQHGHAPRASRAAARTLRDRRRSRLGPDRRSAHAAHHLRSGRQRERRSTPSTTRRSRDSCRRQTRLVNELVATARRLLERGEDRSRGCVALFKAQLGSPKNKRLMKCCSEQGVKQLVQQAWSWQHLADRKLPPSKQQLRDIENDLLFVMDEKGHSVHLTDRGVDELMSPQRSDAVRAARYLGGGASRSTTIRSCRRRRSSRRAALIEAEYAAKSEKLHIVHQLLRAHALYEKDVKYVVQDGQVLIVDEFTGRTMPGRRWSDGLAPGGRGEGRRAGEGRDADARHDHDSELLPHVRQAGRHDRHRRDRGDASSTRSTGSTSRSSRRTSRSSARTGTTWSTRRGARSTTRSRGDASGCTSWASRCWSER